MLTVIIRAYSGPEALGVSLRAAFPGVVSGLIADAVVVAPPGASDCAELADAAGAVVAIRSTFANGFKAACGLARQDTIMLLDGGISFEASLLEALRQAGPLAEGRVLATRPVQLGMRGVMQRVLGRVTRDQMLLMKREHAALLTRDPWELRYGKALKSLSFRTERPRP
jgi:hypothetical protein